MAVIVNQLEIISETRPETDDAAGPAAQSARAAAKPAEPAPLGPTDVADVRAHQMSRQLRLRAH